MREPYFKSNLPTLPDPSRVGGYVTRRLLGYQLRAGGIAFVWKVFPITARGDANRRHCSKQCAKRHNTKNVKGWNQENPDAMRKYNQTRTAKNPGVWKERHQKDRLAIIELLGGRCVVCGVKNPNWLHVDYVPTTRDLAYRHPRHLRFIREHCEDFRLLCANHHYELTLTGKIEGTDITQ